MSETAPLPVPNQLKAQLKKCKTVRNADVRTTQNSTTARVPAKAAPVVFFSDERKGNQMIRRIAVSMPLSIAWRVYFRLYFLFFPIFEFEIIFDRETPIGCMHLHTATIHGIGRTMPLPCIPFGALVVFYPGIEAFEDLFLTFQFPTPTFLFFLMVTDVLPIPGKVSESEYCLDFGFSCS